MKCPLCSAEMISGKLYGDKYALKWLPSGQKLFLGIWAIGGETIDSRTGGEKYLARTYSNGHKCEHCRKIILDI
jgi:hypothetical protein